MRDRRRTIESLRRLVERPGTPAEGETARRLLEKMQAKPAPKLRVFRAADFPVMTEIWYSYWCYLNVHGYIAKGEAKMLHGKIWLRIRFDHLKNARWVPVTSPECGCHLSLTPFSEQEAMALHNAGLPMAPDWDALLRETYRRASA